jgi:CRP/FNR family transcriptional regulator, cyclic AMP receptor protein
MKVSRESSALELIIADHKAATQPLHFRLRDVVFTQGDTADSLYFVERGRIKLSVISPQGKEAIVALVQQGGFFGESCLVGQSRRITTAQTLTDCSLLRFEKQVVLGLLHSDARFVDGFVSQLVNKSMRMEEDIVDHIFNTSEKRLARLLLILANYGKDTPPEPIRPKISQEMLAEMVGTTRSRVSQFMNKFRELGHIEYDGEIRVNSSLVAILLQETDKQSN